MQFLKTLSLIVLSSLTALQISFASESAPAKEAPKETGEASEKKDEAVKEPAKQSPEWLKMQNDLNSLQAKVKAKQESIRGLVTEKNRVQDPKQVKQILDTMTAEYKEMRKLTEEYEKQRTILLFRYPDKGKVGSRSYEKILLKSLEDMDTEFGVEGRLNKGLKKMRQQYGSQDMSDIEKKKRQKEIENSQGTTIQDETIILSK